MKTDCEISTTIHITVTDIGKQYQLKDGNIHSNSKEFHKNATVNVSRLKKEKE